MNDCINILFTIPKLGTSMHSTRNSKKNFECKVLNGRFSCHVYYDFHEKPLSLESSVKEKDSIHIVLMPFRIELWVNSELRDEEWPAGNCLFQIEDKIESDLDVSVYNSTYTPEIMPEIVRVFQNACDWKPEENVFVGDCMPYEYDDYYHVLYLKDRHHHQSKWGKGAHQWSHISTKDFVNWNVHPTAVGIDDPDEASICTGSWIYHDSRHYLFYTVRTCDYSPAPIRRSVSSNGYHYMKDKDFGFQLSDRYTGSSARDPKIVRDSDNLFHMFVTTSLNNEKTGCLAHFISTDLNHWSETERPIFIAPKDMGEPECPDYFYQDGYYYLICSLHGTGYYMVSKEPFAEWQFNENQKIPCHSVPKCAIWHHRIIFTGFDGGGVYGGTMKFLEAKVDKQTGNLYFHDLHM